MLLNLKPRLNLNVYFDKKIMNYTTIDALIVNNLSNNIEVIPIFFKILFSSSIAINIVLVYRYELLIYIHSLISIFKGNFVDY